ncbi:MAG: M28 family peptidase [Planctomycetaceae bacterium]|nr:M28 family peptidase [Planctomycetaceae bacterium]
MTDIEADRLQRHLAEIVRPRPSGSDELESLRNYVTDQLQSFGWNVRRHEFEAVSGIGDRLTGIQLIATLPSARADSWLCVAAHLDSRFETPGADDNASGVVGLLEIARCWPDWRPAHGTEVELVVTDLEEEGMLGGAEHARLWLSRPERLLGMVALEMIGYCDQRPHTQMLPKPLVGKYPTTGNFIAVIGNQVSTHLIEFFRDGLQEIPRLPVETLQVPENGNLLQAVRLSDHSPFWDAGFPAVMITDTSFLRNPHYPRGSDTIETLDINFLRQVTAGCLRAIRSAVGQAF